MVSFRNFFSICSMMAVLFFMFQFFLLFKEGGNTYDINEYAEREVLSGRDRWDGGQNAGTPEVLFLGEEQGGIYNVARQWCLYTKRRLVLFGSLEEMGERAKKGQAEMLLIDGSLLQLPEQEEDLTALLDAGVTTVFARLPEPEKLAQCGELQKLLGISQVQAWSVETLGFQVYPGFLLGGEALYQTTENMSEKQKKLQDMELSIPWYRLGTGTKVYMTGLFDEDETDRELFPPVLWRNSYKGTFVFAVNGDYMTQLTGMGILDAFCYEGRDYYLYPVINAENITVAGFPGFADENPEKIMELYSRSPGVVQQDVMWPGLYALAEKNRRTLTFFFMPQYDYSDDVWPSGGNVVFFLKQIKEIGGEAGAMLEYKGSVALADKLSADQAFWEQNCSAYRFLAYYAGEEIDAAEREAMERGKLADARTVVSGYPQGGSLVSYINDKITFQGITGHAESYSYLQDLQRRGLETALGYYNLLLDLKPALWPESKDDQWENYFDDISSNVSTYWSPGDGFESTSLSESDIRVRYFLNLDYSQERQGDIVSLRVEGAPEAWFVLRTHGEEIKSLRGGTSRMLETNVYLIHVTEPDVEIELGKETGQNGFYFSK